MTGLIQSGSNEFMTNDLLQPNAAGTVAHNSFFGASSAAIYDSGYAECTLSITLTSDESKVVNDNAESTLSISTQSDTSLSSVYTDNAEATLNISLEETDSITKSDSAELTLSLSTQSDTSISAVYHDDTEANIELNLESSSSFEQTDNLAEVNLELSCIADENQIFTYIDNAEATLALSLESIDYVSNIYIDNAEANLSLTLDSEEAQTYLDNSVCNLALECVSDSEFIAVKPIEEGGYSNGYKQNINRFNLEEYLAKLKEEARLKLEQEELLAKQPKVYEDEAVLDLDFNLYSEISVTYDEQGNISIEFNANSDSEFIDPWREVRAADDKILLELIEFL